MGGTSEFLNQDLPTKKFRALSEVFGGVLYELYHPGGKLDWSEHCWRMFGFSREEMGSDIQGWLMHIHPQDRTHALKEMYRVMRAGQPMHIVGA